MAETAYDPPKTNPVTALWNKLSARFHAASPYAKSLLEGVFAGGVVFLLLVIWMVIRADRTAEKIQHHFPYETTQIIRTEPETKIDPVPAGSVGQTPREGEEKRVAERNTNALPAAPIDGLIEDRDGLTLPIARIADDLTPFHAYKRPFTPIPGRHLVSVVVTDFGLSESLSQTTIEKLPPDVSLALSPYADNAADWAAMARQNGHEIWISLPMQTKETGDDLGPNAVMLKSGLQQKLDSVMRVLGSAVGYAGIISQKNHAFDRSDIDIEPVLKQIYDRGLAFAESNPDGYAFGEAQAAKIDAPYVRNDFWLGDDLRGDTLDRTMQAAELMAMKQGHAVIFVHPYPVVLDKLEAWMAGGEARGLQFAPLSALAE